MFMATKSGARRRDAARHAQRRADGIRQLPAGTVLHCDGIPIVLRYSAEVQTDPGNWTQIDANYAAEQDVKPPTWAATRFIFGVGALIMGALSVGLYLQRDETANVLMMWTVPMTLGSMLTSVFAHRWARADNRGAIGE